MQIYLFGVPFIGESDTKRVQEGIMGSRMMGLPADALVNPFITNNFQ